MDMHNKDRTFGSYTANLRGNRLQGHDVLTLELILNEDDAKAKEIFRYHVLRRSG